MRYSGLMHAEVLPRALLDGACIVVNPMIRCRVEMALETGLMNDLESPFGYKFHHLLR